MSRRSRQRPSRTPLSTYLVGGLVGTLVVALLGTMFVLVGHVSILTARRADPSRPFDAVLQNSFLEVVPLSTTELHGLREAKLESSASKKGSMTYRVVFVTTEGDVPMTAFFRGGRQPHEDVVQQINAGLHEAGSTAFTIKHVGAGWFAVLPVVVLAITALVFVVWALKALIRLAFVWPEEEALMMGQEPASFDQR